MATPLVTIPDSNENVFADLRNRIDQIFDSLIQKVDERRQVLLQKLTQLEEEFHKMRSSCMQSLEDSKRERDKMEQLLVDLKINQARTSLEKGITDLTEDINAKEQKLNYPRLSFVCDVNKLHTKISKFGSLIDDTDRVPRKYSSILKPLKLFGSFGEGEGEFSSPRGILVDNDNQRILIADFENSRIQVWSMNGVYLTEFGTGILVNPWEMVSCGNYLFISDLRESFLSKWNLDTFDFLNKTNSYREPEPGELAGPAGLDVDNGELFVVECSNYRISVFDFNLKFKRIMADKAIQWSHCIKIRNGTIYIVEHTGIIKLFSKDDQLLKTIRNYSEICEDTPIYNFYLDSMLNFLILRDDNLDILSPCGNRFCCIPFQRHVDPSGIDQSIDGQVVVSFSDGSIAVAIFDFVIPPLFSDMNLLTNLS